VSIANFCCNKITNLDYTSVFSIITKFDSDICILAYYSQLIFIAIK
jgi:hypothetical protein